MTSGSGRGSIRNCWQPVLRSARKRLLDQLTAAWSRIQTPRMPSASEHEVGF
jgi:hypothetical protein